MNNILDKMEELIKINSNAKYIALTWNDYAALKEFLGVEPTGILPRFRGLKVLINNDEGTESFLI